MEDFFINQLNVVTAQAIASNVMGRILKVRSIITMALWS